MPIAFYQVRPICICCIDPVALLVAYSWQIVGIIHAQHIEQVFASEFTKRLSAHLFDNVLQSNEVQTTVTAIGLRFETTLAGLDIFHQAFRTWRTVLLFQLSRRTIRRKTGSMCQQIGYTNSLLFLTVFACPVLESRNIDTDRITQTNLATFHQNHGTNGSRHGLAARCHIEDCLCSHRFHCRIDTLVAISLQVCHLAIANDSKYGTRNIFVGNSFFYDFVCIHQPTGIHTHLFGCYPLQRLGNRRCDAEQRHQ